MNGRHCCWKPIRQLQLRLVLFIPFIASSRSSSVQFTFFLSFILSFIPFSFSISRRSARRVMRVLSALQRDLNDIRSKWDGRLGRFMRSSAFHLFIERRWHQGGLRRHLLCAQQDSFIPFLSLSYLFVVSPRLFFILLPFDAKQIALAFSRQLR